VSLRWSLVVALTWTCSILHAEAQSGGPLRFGRWVSDDLVAAAKGIPTSQTAFIAGGMTAGLLLTSLADASVTNEARTYADATPKVLRRVLHEVGNAKVVRPLAVVFFLGTLAGDNERLQDAAFTSVETLILANLVTNGLKLAVGRARPSEGLGSSHIAPFSGHRSFPSGHATTAFALAVPWLIYYPRIETYALAALAVGTSIVRVIDDFHWMTDTIAGAMIGGGAGYLLARRHLRAGTSIRLRPTVVGGSAGVQALVRF